MAALQEYRPTAPRRPSPPTRSTFVRRRTVALGVSLGLLAIVVALALGDGGSPFQAAVNTTLTPAQEAKLPWRQSFVSGTAGPLDSRGLPSPTAQRQAVRHFYRLGLPIYCGGGRGNYATVTFDDGPSSRSEEIMRQLRRAGAQTTYFLIGRSVADFPNVPREQVALGGVANHTWTHANLPSIGTAGARSELTRTTAAIQQAAGQPVTLMRPPYGARDPATDRVAHRGGLLPIMWDSDTQDSLGASADSITQNAIEGLRPGGIVLMHETHDTTLTALPKVLAAARQKGLRLVSIPQLLALDPPTDAQVRDGANGCSDRERYQQQQEATALRLARDGGAGSGITTAARPGTTTG